MVCYTTRWWSVRVTHARIKCYDFHTISKGDKKAKYIFSELFSLKCKLCIVWNWYIAKIILILQKYLFWRLLKMMANQILKYCLSSNFLFLWSVSHVKFTEVCAICTKKYVLTAEIFTNALNMDLPIQARVEKTDNRVKTLWLSLKIFWVHQSVKKVTLRVFEDIKCPITVDFFEKGTTVNSPSYHKLLDKFHFIC